MYKSERISYSTGNNLDDNKIYINLSIIDHKERFNTRVRFLLNTGYSSILLNANKLGIKLTEQEFRKKYNEEPIKRGELNKNSQITLYRFYVDELKLGRFIIRKFPVYITFNNSINLPILGNSLLRLFDVNIKYSMKYIKFTETKQYKDFTSGKLYCYDIDNNDDSYISIDNRGNSHSGFIIDLIDKLFDIL